jgi:thiol reductant ABC exporter CydD subunit
VKPFDPRLLRRATATRGFLAAAIGAGVLQAVLVIASAFLLSGAVDAVFRQGAGVAQVRSELIGLAAVAAARGLVAFSTEAAAFGAAAKVKSQLRMAVAAKTLRVGPLRLAGADPGELAALSGRGIDALDAYFARYLPQLVLAVVVPLAVGLTVLTQDVLTAVILALTLPLIPVFMILIGQYTEAAVRRQWGRLSQLSGFFLDLVAGLPTLRIFGRAAAQADQLRSAGDRYRTATMRVLRVSFLSALVLELLATLSVAIVAVSIGLRLVEGGMDFRVALFVLILAPEAYLPVRQVGMHFHAAAEGLGASGQLLSWLDEPEPASGGRPAPAVAGEDLVLSGVSAGYRGAAVLDGFSAVFRPGRITALVGPSGAGKSTVLAIVLRFLEPAAGTVRVGGAQVSAIDAAAWRALLAWVPQQPALLPGTVADNVRLGAPDASPAAVLQAMAQAGLADLEPGTTVGEGGSGVSAGQRRRIALARALLREAPIMLLDEPTAALDPATEQIVLATLRHVRDAGRTVVVVAHRQAVVDAADDVVRVPLLGAGLPAPVRQGPGQLLPGVPR